MTTIREMTVADLPEVFEVRVSTRENSITLQEMEAEHGITPAGVAEAMQDFAKGWVCEVDGKIVGFSMGDADTGEMTVLAVLPEYEKRGIGKKLLTKAQEWLFGLGHEQLCLATTHNPNLRAYGFYLSQGWRATGELVTENEEKFVLQHLS